MGRGPTRMTQTPVPDEVRRFVLTSVPSVPYLEALLLLRAGGDQPWDALRVSRRLYIGEAQALDIIANDPAAAGKAVGQELNLSPADAQNQLSQGVFLKPADLSAEEWLGTEAKVGKLAENLVSASEFLKGQQKIDAVPDLATVQKSIYVKGLPDVLS